MNVTELLEVHRLEVGQLATAPKPSTPSPRHQYPGRSGRSDRGCAVDQTSQASASGGRGPAQNFQNTTPSRRRGTTVSNMICRFNHRSGCDYAAIILPGIYYVGKNHS